MNRKMTQIAIFVVFALSLMAFTAMAQKTEKQEKAVAKELAKKEGAEVGKKDKAPGLVHTGDLTRRPTITITEVAKKDAAAKSNPNGAGRLVPVEVLWDAKLPAGAKLIEMNCVLRTKNTNGQTTVVEHLMPVEKFVPGRIGVGGTIMLPMPEGVFAKEFTLTMKGKFRIADQVVAESVTKSGVFPELHEKK